MGAQDLSWSPEERAALLASVGGGAHVRPLSPTQVGLLLTREIDRGLSQDALASALYLDSSAMVGRFARLVKLPPEVGAAVGWGRSDTAINLTQAQEIARLPRPDAMRELARLTLEYGLSGAEVRGVVQICLRRGVDPAIAVEETVRLRPVIERRYIQLGRVTNDDLAAKLARLTAEARQALIRSALVSIGLTARDCSLQDQGYALVLDEETARTADADDVEERLNAALMQSFREQPS